MENQGSGRGWHGNPEGHAAAGRKGGASQMRTKGREYFVELGRRGGRKTSQDRAHMAAIGSKGGAKVSADRQHMAEIGRIGGAGNAKLSREAKLQIQYSHNHRNVSVEQLASVFRVSTSTIREVLNEKL